MPSFVECESINHSINPIRKGANGGSRDDQTERQCPPPHQARGRGINHSSRPDCHRPKKSYMNDQQQKEVGFSAASRWFPDLRVLRLSRGGFQAKAIAGGDGGCNPSTLELAEP